MKLNVFDKPNPDELARMVRRENVGAKKPTNSGCPDGQKLKKIDQKIIKK